MNFEQQLPNLQARMQQLRQARNNQHGGLTGQQPTFTPPGRDMYDMVPPGVGSQPIPQENSQNVPQDNQQMAQQAGQMIPQQPTFTPPGRDMNNSVPPIQRPQTIPVNNPPSPGNGQGMNVNPFQGAAPMHQQFLQQAMQMGVNPQMALQFLQHKLNIKPQNRGE